MARCSHLSGHPDHRGTKSEWLDAATFRAILIVRGTKSEWLDAATFRAILIASSQVPPHLYRSALRIIH